MILHVIDHNEHDVCSCMFADFSDFIFCYTIVLMTFTIKSFAGGETSTFRLQICYHRFFEMLQMKHTRGGSLLARSLQTYISLTTNITLLKPSIAKYLYDDVFCLEFSEDGGCLAKSCFSICPIRCVSC